MVTHTTQGITIKVETFYQAEYSSPINFDYLFAYQITIANESNDPIKLLRRHWHIVESNAPGREVEGEGVVGEQPLILPMKEHTYTSGCDLQSEIGAMYGTYLVRRETDQKEFLVEIPIFILVAPFKLN